MNYLADPDEVVKRRMGPPLNWTIDATSGKACPASAGEWSAFIAANNLSIAVPNHLWLCQESSGDLSDSIGTLTLIANANPLYRQTVSGWSRLAVGFDGTVNQCFYAAPANGPNIATQSVCWLCIVLLETPPGNQSFIALSDSASGLRTTAVSFPASRVRFTYSGVGSKDGLFNPMGAVRPYAVMHDITGERARLFTDQEVIVPTFQPNRTNGNKGIGGFSGIGAASGSRFLYGCAWSGTNAEITDADMKSLLEAMGWTIPWS